MAASKIKKGDAVVVLAGRGKSFSAGGDLNWMKAAGQASVEENLEDARKLAAMLRALAELSKPTIPRVHGAAPRGGLGLAGTAARLGTGLRLGFGGGSCFRLGCSRSRGLGGGFRHRLDHGDQARMGRPSRYEITGVNHPRSSTTDDADPDHGRSQILGRNESGL